MGCRAGREAPLRVNIQVQPTEGVRFLLETGQTGGGWGGEVGGGKERKWGH